MPVSREITRLEKSNVKLTLTIPKEEVSSAYRDILRDYAKEAQIPGFRRGKVPPGVLERKFGEAIRGEAVGKLVEGAIEETFGDEGLSKYERPLPYSRPALDANPEFSTETDLSFSLEYDVMPKANVGRWKGFKAEIPLVEVGDEDVARELEEIRERNSFVLDRDDGAKAAKGDIATVDYWILDDAGKPTEGGETKDFVLTIGKGRNPNIPEDEIEGMVKGQTKEFDTPKAEDGDDSGDKKPERIRLTLTALKEKKLPDLDDELAQDVDEKYSSLDDLKKSIRERLEANLKSRKRELRLSGVLEKIMAENDPVVLPESMVQAEIAGRIRALGRSFGLGPDAVMRMLASGDDGLENIGDRWRPAAEKALKSGVTVAAIMEELKIEASDDDLKMEVERIASESGTDLAELREHYAQDGNIEQLRDGVMERKAEDAILAENTVTDGPRVSYLDFMSNNG